MVDSTAMAVLNSIQDLEESAPGKLVVADKIALFCNVAKEIPLRAIFDDNIRAIGGIENLHQGYDIGVATGATVQSNLTLLELHLTWFQTNFVQRFNSVFRVGVDVQSSVHDAVSSDTKYTGQLESSRQDLADAILWCAESIECGRWWWGWEHAVVVKCCEECSQVPVKASEARNPYGARV
jgi:hypothetical protein